MQKALKGMSYPASGSQLADQAESNGAGSDLVEELRGIGDEVSGPDQVMAALKGILGDSTGE